MSLLRDLARAYARREMYGRHRRYGRGYGSRSPWGYRQRRSPWGFGGYRRQPSYGWWGGYPRRRSNVRVVGCCLPFPIGALALAALALRFRR